MFDRARRSAKLRACCRAVLAESGITRQWFVAASCSFADESAPVDLSQASEHLLALNLN